MHSRLQMRTLAFATSLALAFLAGSRAQATPKEEMISFVNEAQAFARTHSRAEALKEFNDPKGKFVRGELYIFAFNFKGICLAHGATPVLVGHDMINVTDRAGTKAIAELANAARKGEGTVEYMWQNPAKKDYENKVSYVVKMDDDWFLGAGIYLGAVDPTKLKR